MRIQPTIERRLNLFNRMQLNCIHDVVTAALAE
jgi:hypothetical protein